MCDEGLFRRRDEEWYATSRAAGAFFFFGQFEVGAGFVECGREVVRFLDCFFLMKDSIVRGHWRYGTVSDLLSRSN